MHIQSWPTIILLHTALPKQNEAILTHDLNTLHYRDGTIHATLAINICLVKCDSNTM